MASRKVLLIVGSLAAGGTERVAVTLAEAWARSGHSIVLMTLTGVSSVDHYSISGEVQRRRVDLMWDSISTASRLLSALRRRKLLRAAVLREHPEVIVSFGDITNVRVLMACLGCKIPVIVSERTDPRRQVLPQAWRLLRSALYPFSARVIVQTNSVARWARLCVWPGRFRVIPNPVRSLPALGPRPHLMDGRRVVIAVGRLSAEKGFDVLLHAFTRAGLLSEDWQLIIIGDGPERATLEALSKSLGLNNFLMPGVVHDPENWLRYSTLFVLSSRYEGFPNALLEAMRCGLPVAAFDCPSGPAEIIQHDLTGLLVPPSDPDALARTIRRLALDTALCRRLGAAAAHDVLRRFDLHRISEQWVEVWNDAIGTKASGA